jgi:hypothetical protein
VEVKVDLAVDKNKLADLTDKHFNHLKASIAPSISPTHVKTFAILATA